MRWQGMNALLLSSGTNWNSLQAEQGRIGFDELKLTQMGESRKSRVGRQLLRNG